MDQLPELYSYRVFFENRNLTSQFKPTLNFSEASEILTEFTNSLFTLNTFTTVLLLTLYAPIFLLGLIGNILIIAILSAEKAKKPKLYFMINLALADLAVTLLCIPPSVGTIVYGLWVYGRFLCKFIAFIQGVAVAVSIFSMMAMAINLYISLQHPAAKCRLSFTSAKSFALICIMWVVAGSFMGPLIYIRDIDTLDIPFSPDLTFCIEKWPQDRDRQAYGVFLLVAVFIIPAFTIGVCYGHVGEALFKTDIPRADSNYRTRRVVKRKLAARMVIFLVVAFLVCWLPYNVLSAVADLESGPDLARALPFVLWLGHAQSAVNPAMYWLMNKRFRESVCRMVKSIRTNHCISTDTISTAEFM
ncbi:hypothetical protein CHS0354_014276 [Potamilus streckersoni]|uniref:G-protein coupled receptors family 1 profile domain-containing protein n=1 Tax=Potamilus streckersoni TaxID=2493646 RepID=A0AAE0VXI5_9BIVA|nr:hypothetical protein CHS0354_014276 [Potamilus streckersoni]